MPHVRDLNPLSRAVLLAALLLLLGLLFHQLVTLMVAILATILIAIPLSGMATWLERWGVPRWLGAFAGLVIGLGFLAGVLALLIPPFLDQTRTFVDQVPSIVDTIQAKVNHATSPNAGDDIQQFLQRYTDHPAELIGPLASIGLNVAGVLGALALIVITAFYMAVNPRPLLDGAVALLPPERRDWARGVMERLRVSWIGWMQGVLVDMLVTGVLLYIGLRIVGLDFAIFFAVFSAILVLIPYFGSIVGGIPPVAFALSYSPGKALVVLGVYLLVQQIESNLTIPIVMANRVKLHPAVVAIGVVVVGALFGFIGLFVAVPILSAIVIAVDELWVKPMEAHRGIVEASELDRVDEAAERPDADHPEEPAKLQSAAELLG
jgi:predicted PurR-regulated permease PerM